jgi:guanylate kinase
VALNRNTNKGKIVVISGPSGSGKTTLREELLQDEELGKRFVKSVSFTTRRKRSCERNNKDYIFISEPEFKKRLKAKKILEWTKYLGYYYATSKDFVDKQLARRKNIILCLDLKGALRIKKLYPRDSLTIFIAPPSIKALQHRIEGRCNKTREEEIQRRLELARQELSDASKHDYRVVNKNLAQAAEELKGIILNRVRCKV